MPRRGNSSQSPESRKQIEDFVHRVVSGKQQELVAAYCSLKKMTGRSMFKSSLPQQGFKAILDRMADGFVFG